MVAQPQREPSQAMIVEAIDNLVLAAKLFYSQIDELKAFSVKAQKELKLLTTVAVSHGEEFENAVEKDIQFGRRMKKTHDLIASMMNRIEKLEQR